MTDRPTEFAAVILSLDDGATHSELTETLCGLVARVRDTGKAGALTEGTGVEVWHGVSA